MTRLWLLALLAGGCGRELHHTVDAQPADAAPDVVVPDNGEPPANAVTLTITRQGAPVPGLSVVFQGAGSEPIATEISDTTGRAWAVMPAGGFVTALERIGAGLDELTTFAGVQAGDALRLDMAPTGDLSTATVTVTVPLDTVTPTDGYEVRTSCGSARLGASGTAQVTLVGCAGVTDVVVYGVLDDVPTGRAFHAASVTIPTSGTVAVTGTYEPFVTNTLDFTNVPDEVSSIVGDSVISATHRAYQVSEAVVPSGGVATAQVALPATTGTILRGTHLYPNAGEVGQQSIYEWGVASPTYVLDVASAALPAFAEPPTAAGQTIAWTERAGGAAPDVVRARATIYRDDIPTGRAWRWRIAAPRSGTSVTLPTLPAMSFDYNPAPGDSVAIDELQTLVVPGGFDAWRTHPFTSNATELVIGGEGRAVVQTLYSPEL